AAKTSSWQRQRNSIDGSIDLPYALRQLLEIASSDNVGILESRHKTAVALGVDVRMPFGDRELIEFCIGLPPEQRVRDGWSRFILRCALRDTLPFGILTRGSKWSAGPAI